MKNIIKSALKVLGDYFVSLIIFVLFLYTFFVITKENYSKWIPLYSGVNFVLMVSLMYTDMKKLARKEKRPQYNLNPYPLKGFVLGIIGFLPVIILEIVYIFLNFNSEVKNRVAELALKAILGPVYIFVRLAGGTTFGYVLASLVVPIVAMLGYMAGYYGFELRKTKLTQNPADNKTNEKIAK